MIVKPYNRNHRTALVFDISAGLDSEERERIGRLVESLNRPGASPNGTIKVDFYTFDGTTLRPGTPSEYVEDDYDSTPDFEAFAKDAGYVQLLVDKPLKG